jgi:hypothetical protein
VRVSMTEILSMSFLLAHQKGQFANQTMATARPWISKVGMETECCVCRDDEADLNRRTVAGQAVVG